MADNILPEPVDNIPDINPVYKISRRRRPNRSLVVLVAIVVIAFLGLVSGVVYNYIHGHDQDSTRKQDLAYIATQAETFHQLNHYYPTLAQINSDTLAAFSPNGINKAKFKDPSSSSEKLTASPSASSYAYEAAPEGCDNVKTKCLHFKIVAILSSDSKYTVVSKH